MASKHCQESGQCLPLQVDQERSNAPMSQEETGADKNHTVGLVTVDYKPKEIQQMYAAHAGKPASQKQFNAVHVISRINSELRDKQELTLRVLYGFQYTSQRGINIKAISPQFRNINSEIDKVFSKPEIQIQEVDNLTSMLEKLEENLNIVHQSNETDFSLKKARSDEYEILHGAIILGIKNELEKKKKLCELLHHFTQYASSQCDTSILQHLADEIDQVFSKPKALVQLGIDGLLSMLQKLQQKQKIEDSSDSATIPCKEGTPQSQYAATIKQSQSEEGRKVHVTTKEEEDEEEKAVEGKASSLTQEDDVSSSKGRVTMVNASVQPEGETQATPQEAIGTNQPPTEEKEDVGPEDTTEAATAEQTKKEEEVVSKKVTKSYAEVVKSGHASCSQAKQQLKGPGSLLKETKKAARPSSTQHLSPAPAVPTPSSAPSENSKTDGEGWQVVQERRSTKARLSSKSAEVPLGQMEHVNRSSVLIDSNEDLSAIDDDAISDTEEPGRKELGRSSCATRMTASQKKRKTRKSAGRRKKVIRGKSRQTRQRRKPTSNVSRICTEGTTSGQGSGAGQQKDEIEKEESAGHSSPNADTNLSLSPIPTPPSAPQERSNQEVAKDRSKLPKTSMLSRKADPVAMNESQQKRKSASARKDDNAESDPEPGRKESGSALTTTSVRPKSSNCCPFNLPMVDNKTSKIKSAQAMKKTRKMQSQDVKQTKTSLARAARFHKNDQKKMESGWSKRGRPGLGNICRQEEPQTRAKGKPNIPGDVDTRPKSGQGRKTSESSKMDCKAGKIRSEQRNTMNLDKKAQVKQTKTSLARAAGFQSKGVAPTCTDQMKKSACSRGKPVPQNTIPAQEEQQERPRIQRRPSTPSTCTGPDIPRSGQSRERSSKRVRKKTQQNSTSKKSALQVKQTKTSMTRAAKFPNTPTKGTIQLKRCINYRPKEKEVVSTTDQKKKKSAKQSKRDNPVPGNSGRQEEQLQARSKKKPNAPSNVSTGPGIPRSGQGRESRSSVKIRPREGEGGTTIRRDRRGQDLCQLDKTAGADQAVRPKIREKRSEREAKKTAIISPFVPSDLNNERASHRRRNIRCPDYGTINIISNPLSSHSPNIPSSLSQDGLYNNTRQPSAVESDRNWALPGEENWRRRMDSLLTQLLSGLPDQNVNLTRDTTLTGPNGVLDVTLHIQAQASEDEDVQSPVLPRLEENSDTSRNDPNGGSNPNIETHFQRPGASARDDSNSQGNVPVTSSPWRGGSRLSRPGGRAPDEPAGRYTSSPIRSGHLSGRSNQTQQREGRTSKPQASRIARTNSCQELGRHPGRRDQSEERIASCGGARPVCRVEPSQQRTAVCNVCNHSDQGSASQQHPRGAYITVLDHAGQFLCRKRTPLTSVQNFARSIHAIVFENLVLRSFTLRCLHGYNIPWNTTLGYQDTTVQVFPADEHGSWSWRIIMDDDGFVELEPREYGD